MLSPRFMLGSLDLTDRPYGVEFGSDFGSPETVSDVLNSLLMDGELLSSTRASNREITLSVIIEGSDLLDLAEAEAALVAEADRQRNALMVDPGDGFGPPTVFDTFRSQLKFERSDDGEAALLRRYSLTIPALPYGRSTTLVAEVAEGIPSVGTVVNSCESTTGWSAPAAEVPGSSYGGYVEVDPQPANMLAVDSTTFVEGAGSIAAKSWRVYATRYVDFLPTGDARLVSDSVSLTQPIDIPVGAYLSFAVKFDSTYGETLTSYFGETYQRTGVLETFSIAAGSASRTYKKFKENYDDKWTLSKDAIVEALADGWTRYTLKIDEAMSITEMTWTSDHLVPWADDPAAADRPRILVDQVAVAETATLGPQVLKTIDVGGSARTTGAIHVAAPSDSVALGQVLAFTVPQSEVATGFRPDLSQWVESGATTTTVGGRTAYSDLNGAGSPVFTVPASALRSGAYTVVASLYQTTSALSFTASTSLLIDGVSVATGGVGAQGSAYTSTWWMYNLGTIYLPPISMQQPGVDALVQFTVAGVSSLSELYVFPVEGDLSIINCGTGTVGPHAASHLWIDSPSPDQPEGGYWTGTTPTRQNALSAWSSTIIPGIHTFEPPSMLAFVASLGAQGPTVSFDYYPRWFFNAAR